MRRIGVLMGLPENDADTNARLAGFRQELERLGWSEGRNVRIDYRFAPAGARAPVLAKELVALQPDVILSNSTPVTAALQHETRTIPIVFTGVTADPIAEGFVTSLACAPTSWLRGLPFPVRCDFDVESASEFNGFQANSLRNKSREFANAYQGIFFEEQGI
jgi:ABC transporter substrate binding protein